MGRVGIAEGLVFGNGWDGEPRAPRAWFVEELNKVIENQALES